MPRRAVLTSSYRLRLPTDLDDTSLTRLLGALSSDLRPVSVFQLRPVVRLRVRSYDGRIEHHLDVGSTDQRIMNRMRSLLPSIRLDESASESLEPTVAIELKLSNFHRPLRTDRAVEISSAVLGALGAGGRGETVELQWFISGERGGAPARRIPHRGRNRSALERVLAPAPSTWHYQSADVRQEQLKQAEPLLVAAGRIGVEAESSTRARQLITGVLRALQMVDAPGVGIGMRFQLAWLARRRFVESAVPLFSWPLLLNASELASVVGWPVGPTVTPGLSLGAARQLPASRSLTVPSPGSVTVAESSFAGSDRPIRLGRRERLSHLHVAGPTGVGKSTLLANLALQSIEAGDSIVVVDPKGDLVTDILGRIPDTHHNDVVVMDPSDTHRPVGLNPLQSSGVPGDVVVDHVASVFADLFRRSWGPRTADVLRASLLTLQAGRSATFVDLPELLSSPGFRRPHIEALPSHHPAHSFWSWYEAISDAERAAVIGPLMNKLRAFTLRESVRGVIGQPTPRFQPEEVFTRRRILLVPLPAGLLGEEAAQLIGSLLVARLWQAAQARTQVPAEKRRPVWLLLDEFQQFLRLPTRMGDMLAQARGLGLGLTLAHQHLGQLSPDVQADVLANARSRIVFQTGHKDAVALAKELPGVEADDLTHLEPFELYARLLVGTQAVAPTSGRSLPLPPTSASAAAIRQLSRERWGIDRADIDQRLDHNSSADAGRSWTLGEVTLDADGDIGDAA